MRLPIKAARIKGFTLLEVIIVIIIVGVLAALALPRYFSMIEYSRGTEALNNFALIRSSLERCYIPTKDYTNCNNFTSLDMENPGNVPGAHFTYAIGTGATTYTIVATRNTIDGGNGGAITLSFDGALISKTGTGSFQAVR